VRKTRWDCAGRKTKRALKAEARLWNAQAAQVERATAAEKSQAVADQWEPVTAAIEAGTASWADLSRVQRLSMPMSYQIRCRSAERRRGAGQA
jgi:hypothetical protein